MALASHEIFDRPAGPNSLLGSDLVAFLGAGLAGFAAGFAFGDLREFFTFFLAVPANHRYHLGEMASMLRIDCRQRLQGAASGYERNDRVAQPAMLVSFIAYMPRQCLRQSLPVATQCAVASSRVLYFGGCLMGSSAIFIMGSSPVCARPVKPKPPRRLSRRPQLIHDGHN